MHKVKALNKLWYNDTNHKLVRWYMIVFGAGDSFSRRPVSLECVGNDMSET